MKVVRLSIAAVFTVALFIGGCGSDESTGTPTVTGDDNATTEGTGIDEPPIDEPAPTDDPEVTPPEEVDPDEVIDPDDTELRVEAVDPGFGQSKGGNVITLMGNGFIDGETQVFFGVSQAFDVFVITPKRLTCTTPPGNPGLVDVTAANPVQETSARLDKAFRYQSDILILGAEPPAGNVAGGEPVTISGSGFSQGNTTVLFGDRKAIDVQVVDDLTLHVTTPQGQTPGTVDIHISNDQGLTLQKDGFLYYETPAVDTVSPAAGPLAGGTEVTLTGRGFEPESTVRFGEAEATKVSFVDTSHLVAVTPAGFAEGGVSVTVEPPYGYGGLAEGFVYMGAEPVAGVAVIAVQPAKGSTEGGDLVNVTAYGLTDKTDTVVTIGGAEASIVSLSASLLTVTVETPAGAKGKADVTVTTSEGEGTLAKAYTYEEILSVNTVNPLSGTVDGGTEVTIFGVGFKSGADVRIGALPCSNVEVINAKTIECITPPGSPGGANVTVKQGQESGVLEDGFFYESGTTELFVVDPAKGSKAGGTFVRLLGAGFTSPATVTFGGVQSTHVKVVNSTLITAKTPPGEVGVVDVAVQSGDAEAKLAESFTYFDPVALYGGTWGPSVEGSVNITVLDGGDGSPIPDAFVILKVDPDTPYQGFTNGEGQVTFSGPDVLGEQMVSASKDGYASNSVIAFNATNITIYLIPTPPPSMGPPPPGATISGTVSGLGKYVITPPGSCSTKFAGPQQQCWKCSTAADCGPAAPSCTGIGDTGSYCTRACTADADCDIGYSCLNVSGVDAPQCIPSPGTKEARCYFTMGAQLPQSQDPYIVVDGAFTIPSRLGEVAVVCLGGIRQWGNPDNETNFTAYAFGVKRHVFVAAGPNDVGDIALNHPLTRTITIRLDDPPYDPVIGPNVSVAQVYWDFGSDGMFFHRNFVTAAYMFNNDNVTHVLERQPAAWTGDVYDATFQILAGAITYTSPTDSQEPTSLTVLRNLKDIETDSVYSLDAGQWEAVESGVTHTVNAAHGFTDNNIWAVGDGGAILHFGGLGWGLQASPTEETLYGVWGANEVDVWAVGAKGAAARFDGVTWEPTTIAGTTANLRGIWGAAADDIHVVADGYQGAWHWDGAAWTKQSLAAGEFMDVHGAGTDAVWIVGRYGTVRHFDGEKWVVQSSGVNKHLLSVHAVSATEAYAVGTEGALLKWDGEAWATMPSPTNRTLRAVWAAGPNDVYAVGDGTVLLHYDGIEWADQTIPAKVSYAALQALWGNPTTGKGVALGTSEVLMGPLLQVPQDQNPADGGQMQDYHVDFDVKPGVPAKYNIIEVFIPTPFGDVAVWNITTDGDVFDFDLPDFANIEGTPGIPAGGYGLRIMRGYNEDFDIDNYDNYDFNPKSWAIDTTFFTK